MPLHSTAMQCLSKHSVWVHMQQCLGFCLLQWTGKEPVDVAVEEYQKKSILEPPPPLSRNYWRTAQAWLPRKVPKTRQDVVALRQKTPDMKTGAVSKSHLVCDIVVADVITCGICTCAITV